jgi:hypothetical protein
MCFATKSARIVQPSAAHLQLNREKAPTR